MILEVNNSVQSVTIDKLLPATTYCFRVTARNVVGSSQPSQFLNFTTEEEGWFLLTTCYSYLYSINETGKL